MSIRKHPGVRPRTACVLRDSLRLRIAWGATSCDGVDSYPPDEAGGKRAVPARPRPPVRPPKGPRTLGTGTSDTCGVEYYPMKIKQLPTVVAGTLAALLVGCSSPAIAPHFVGYEASFVLHRLDQREPDLRFNASRSVVRLSPCSTFKIPNSLIALQTGVLRGESALMEWDGTKQFSRAWEKDHTLASAIAVSCVWYFQRVAKMIGPPRMKKYLKTFEYGNQDISGGIQKFWLTSSLKVSAEEQVKFLTQLYRSEFPLDPRVTEILKSLLVLKTTDTAVLSGKTGTGSYESGTRVGWFVGHLKTPEAEYVFATNIHGRKKDLWGRKAQAITEAVLEDLGLWKVDPV